MKPIELTEQDKKEILKAAKETSGKSVKKPYQAIGTIKGVRDTDIRCNFMKLPKDFEGKSVLDIGCNLGAMCYAAKLRNAGRVVGFDRNTILLEAASNVFQRHNYDISLISYNLNIEGYQPLTEILGKKKFDYIFALAIYNHVDDKQILWDIINNYCSDTCWFEGHKRYSADELERIISSNLKVKRIEFLGNIKDHVRRAVFKCIF